MLYNPPNMSAAEIAAPEIETPLEPDTAPTSSKRVFSVKESSVDIKGGRYHSKVVTQAAQKAAKQLFRKADASVTEITFTLREMKKRAKGMSPRNKTYAFSAEKRKRDTPLRIKLEDKEIVIENDFVVKSIKPSSATAADPVETDPVEEEETSA